jgi:hypothetical protein
LAVLVHVGDVTVSNWSSADTVERGDVALTENSTEKNPGALILIRDGVCRLLPCLGFGRQQTMPSTVDRRRGRRVGTTRQFRALGLGSEVPARVSN